MMLAASTASAPPCRTPSTRCMRLPTPPEAITGTFTASLTARVRARSKPSRVPSRSMLVSRISPAPYSTMSLAQSITSRPVDLRPPWVNTSQRGGLPSPLTRLASIATTLHCEPKRAAASRTNSGRTTAAGLIATLSAPALSMRRMSAVLRMPPPTVSGMNTWPATSSTMCTMESRSSWLAEMSRNTSSSAPCSSKRRAISTGLPASRMPTNFTPLTTRPLSTSRQGMMRLARHMLILSQLIRELLRLDEVETAFVQRAANHRAHHPVALGLTEMADIVERAHATRGDHRDGDGACARAGGVDVDAAHHAVAIDVRVHDRLHTLAFETLRDVYDVMIGQLRPAVDRHLAAFRVEAHNDVAGEFGEGVADEMRHVHRIGAEDDVAHPHGEILLDGLVVADAAPDLNRDVGMRLGDAAYGLGIDRLAGECAVHFVVVQAPRARRHPAIGDRDRVVGKHRVVLHAPLSQAHTFAVFEIDGGYQRHKASPKLR